MDSKARVVVVTGATAGVGRAAARAFAREGDYVVLMARDMDRLRATAQEVRELGGRALPIAVDVASAEQVENAAAQAEREAGPIDVWVNNAMATIFSPIGDISPEEFRRATEVTYLGAVYGTMSALRRMRARDAGVIIQVGSALAYRSIPLQSAYCGAKHALHGFTDSIRSELLHDRSRVRISMVQLPGVNTPQFEWCRTKIGRHPQPVGPVYQPEVAAKAIVWAASHKRREIYVGWPAAVTIIGNKWMPRLFDRYLASHAYEQQFTSERIGLDRPDNLFDPVPTPYRAHGAFDRRAHAASPQLWLSLHRGLLGAAMLVGALAALALHRSRDAADVGRS